jgi:hypothetical protein
MFEMRGERTVTLRGGRCDGKVLAIDPKAREVEAYMDMYNVTRAFIAGGLPRNSSWPHIGLLTTRTSPKLSAARKCPSAGRPSAIAQSTDTSSQVGGSQ